jgi:hypothetical protein
MTSYIRAHRTLIGAVACAVILTAVTGFLLTRGNSQTEKATSVTTSGSASPLRLTTEEAVELATHLTSGDAASVESSTVLPPGQELPVTTVRGMAALAPLRLDVSTFKPVAGDVASVVATAAHDQRWRLTIIWQAGRWKLLDTQEATS